MNDVGDFLSLTRIQIKIIYSQYDSQFIDPEYDSEFIDSDFLDSKFLGSE